MSSLALTTERFAAGEPVLVGEGRDETIFVATGAETVDAGHLERLHRLGRGMIVLAVEEQIATRLGLPHAFAQSRHNLQLATPIDAAIGIRDGWSLGDRARTIRTAVDPRSGPGDLTIPGHVHPAPIGSADRAGAAAASLELARQSGGAAAAALCAVVDAAGRPVRLSDARRDRELGRLPFASGAELRSMMLSRQLVEGSVSCELPTRAGLFRAVGHAAVDSQGATIALIHGDPATRARPLVHAHVACLLGDAFGSLLCDCRPSLEAAIAAIVREGAGVIVYEQLKTQPRAVCTRESQIDVATAAALLQSVGITALRLSSPGASFAGQLRAAGLDVT